MLVYFPPGVKRKRESGLSPAKDRFRGIGSSGIHSPFGRYGKCDRIGLPREVLRLIGLFPAMIFFRNLSHPHATGPPAQDKGSGRQGIPRFRIRLRA